MLDQRTAQQILSLVGQALTEIQENIQGVNRAIMRRKDQGMFNNTKLYNVREKLTKRYVKLAAAQKSVKDHSRRGRILNLSHTQMLRSFIAMLVDELEYKQAVLRNQITKKRYKYGYYKESYHVELMSLRDMKAKLADIQVSLREHKNYCIF